MDRFQYSTPIGVEIGLHFSVINPEQIKGIKFHNSYIYSLVSNPLSRNSFVNKSQKINPYRMNINIPYLRYSQTGSELAIRDRTTGRLER